MFQRVRGRAVIINNEHFVESRTRAGSGNDVSDLKKLFDALHFDVILHENLNAEVFFLLQGGRASARFIAGLVLRP